MKIALIKISSSTVPNRLYTHYLNETCAQLVGSGHEVVVYSIGGDAGEGNCLPEGVQLKEVSLPSESSLSYYLDRQQAVSDEVLREVLSAQNTSPYDVIEIPLWGGVGFSLVRAKRLLNELKDTKLVVNAISAAFMLADKTDPSLSMVLQNEMEQYCVRYADVVASPFEPLGDQIKSKFGRSDVRYYDGTFFSSVIEPMDADVQGCKSVLEKMLHQHQPSYLPITIAEIYSSEGKKRFLRSARPVKVSVVVPFSGYESFQKHLDTLRGCPDFSLEKLIYCPTEDEALRSEFQMLDLEDAVKLQSASSAVALDDVLSSCSGDYLVFLKDGMSFTAEYLPRAVLALEQNADISAVGSYSNGDTGLRMPFGSVPGLMGICNTCTMWGNIFRVSKLRQLDMDSVQLAWQGNDWSLLLSLVAKYHLLDVMPFSGLQYNLDPIEVMSSLGNQDILVQMAAFPRVWSSFSSRLLRLLIEDRELLNPIVVGVGETCPVVELPLQSLQRPEAQMNKPSDDNIEQSVQVVPEAEDAWDEPSIPVAASLESDSESTHSVETETDPDGSELPIEEVDHDLEDSVSSKSEKEDHSPETEENETTFSTDNAADFDSPEKADLSTDTVDGFEEQSDPLLDPLENQSDGSIALEEEEVSSADEGTADEDADNIGFDGASDLVGFENEDGKDEDGEDEEWREFPERSEITRLGEESEDNILSSIDEEIVASTPLSLARPGPDGEFESSNFEGDDDDPLDWFQIFWSPDEDFEEENSVSESYHAAETHALEIRIETDEPVKKLRLDPSNRKGKLALRRIEIWNAASHMPVYSSSEENAFDNLVPSGDFEVEGIVHDSLVLDALGRDPQILIDIPESDADRIIISVEFNFMRENMEES